MGIDGIRVMVVDDSAVVRQSLRNIFNAAPGFGDVETAADGRTALRKIARFDPDIVTLDVEMPGLDGLATLKRIMKAAPRPVVMLSAYTSAGAYRTVRALELGALDFIQKPSGSFSGARETIAAELVAKIRALAKKRKRHGRAVHTSPAERRDVVERRPESGCTAAWSQIIVAIGASTGGTEAIRLVLSELPSTFPAGIVVAQHMPEGYTLAFATRLNETCALSVKEASHHDLVTPGRALIAPGHSHLLVRRDHNKTFVDLSRGEKVNGHRPSVDVLLHSVAQAVGPLGIGVVLTGMGKDGAAGLCELHVAGGSTIAQDEASSVVYGMPKAALDEGGVQRVVSLRDVPRAILQAVAAMGPRGRQRETPTGGHRRVSRKSL